MFMKVGQIAFVAYCFTACNLLFPFNMISQTPPDWKWAKDFNGDGGGDGGEDGEAWNSSMDIDPETENIYVTGSFSGSVDFDPWTSGVDLIAFGNRDSYVVKMDPLGNLLWIAQLGGENSSVVANSLVYDTTGNVFITGWFYGVSDFDPGHLIFNLDSEGATAMFITKLDSNGMHIWTKGVIPFTGYTCSGNSIDLDPAGNLYIGGHFYGGPVDFDPGPGSYILNGSGESDIFLLKLNASDDFEWVIQIGSTFHSAAAFAVKVDPQSGSIYLTGTDDSPTYNYGIVVYKFDSMGNGEWSGYIQGGGTIYSAGSAIAVDTIHECIYITGGFQGTCDFDIGSGTYHISAQGVRDAFILKLDNLGNFVWARSLGGAYADSGTAIKLDTFGQEEIYVTGYFRGEVEYGPGLDTLFSPDNISYGAFILKLNHSGELLWSDELNGDGSDVGRSMICSPTGYVYVGGEYDSETLEFDSTISLFNWDVKNVFVSKLNQCRTIVTDPGDSGPATLRDIIACASDGELISFALDTSSLITLTSGEIIIGKNLSISGPGLEVLTISGNNASRIFHLLPDKELLINKLSLKNAADFQHGGAVYSEGHLMLEDMLLENNFESGSPKALTIKPGSELVIGGNVFFHY